MSGRVSEEEGEGEEVSLIQGLVSQGKNLRLTLRALGIPLSGGVTWADP